MKSSYQKLKTGIKAIAGIAILFAILSAILGIIDWRKDMHDHELYRQKAEAEMRISNYKNLVAKQIMSEWECIPQDKKEAYIFSLMQRFTPEDKKTIEDGRVWKRELQQKKEAGTLTVDERTRLNSGNYSGGFTVNSVHTDFRDKRCNDGIMIFGYGDQSPCTLGKTTRTTERGGNAFCPAAITKPKNMPCTSFLMGL